jgi:hypothetical protein
VEEFTVDKPAILILSVLFSIGTNAVVPSNAAEPPGPMDSVTVKAHREELRVLSARMVKLEDQLYADYNQLNPHPQYNIVCTVDAPTDSHLRNRQCLPVFVHDARADEALDFLQQLGFLGGHPARPAGMVVVEKRDDFKKNYRQVINSHPELLKLDEEYGVLEKDYEALLKEMLPGAPAALDKPIRTSQ